MQRRWRDYLLGLAALAAAFCIYALVVVPLVEPPPIKRIADRPEDDPIGPPRNNPFAHLFEPGDWELDSPKVIETDQGTLLFRDYAPQEGGKLEIRPCTLVFFSRDKKSSGEQSARPVVMRASQNAVLQFDTDVDLARASFGRLLGGRILGDVRIFSPESAPHAGDGFEILTHNLQIERAKIITPHDIKFRYGASHGNGRDLVINLAPAEVKANNKAATIGNVETVQLTHVEELNLISTQHSLLPEQGGVPRKSQPPVRITCEGPMLFDVQKRMVTFDEKVQVQQLLPGAPPNQLRCEQLAVFFSDRTEKKVESEAEKSPESLPKKGPAGAAGDVERIVAVGKPVVLDAPSQHAYSESARLEYNVKTRQMQLQSLKSGANVLLRRGTDEFTAPEVLYQVVDGSQLGKLWASGPGKLSSQMVSAKASRNFTALWQSEMRIRPHEGNQVISLKDAAKIIVEGQGEFQADEIHLWVTELPPTARSTKANEANKLAGRILPDRLLATGRVHAESPQLTADVDRLEAWFAQAPNNMPAPETTTVPNAPAEQFVLQPADGSSPPVEPKRPIVRIEERPAPVPVQPAPVVESADAPPPQHFYVVGEVVQMQILQSGSVNEVRELSVEGEKVRVTETNAKVGEEPFWLSGQRIDLEGGTGPTALITASGEPATVSARGMTLQSTVLKLNRRDNRLLVEQAGEMQLPVQQDLNGKSLGQTQQLKISWTGSLLFDGTAAKFRRGVVVKGPDYSASANELQTTLTSHIDFGAAKTRSKQPELKRLSLRGQAQLEHRAYNEEGRQQSIEHIEAASLEIDRPTGDIFGDGPGWVRNVRVGSSPGLGGPAPPMNPMTNEEEGLTYLRVDFQKSLIGNMLKHEVSFQEQVEAVHGPVNHWDEVIAPRSKAEFGERTTLLRTDRLNVSEFVPRGATRGPVEMQAFGKTTVEGRDFDATAARLVYTTAKNQLILEGDGRANARIVHHARGGATEAKRIVFMTDTNAIQFDDGQSLSIGAATNNPAPRPPSPRDRPLR